MVAMVLSASLAWGQNSPKTIMSDGNAFLAECGNYETAPAYCTTYVGGVVDGAQAVSPTPGAGWPVWPTSGFCLPDGVTYGQELRVSIKYMQDHPQQLHVATAYLVIVAQAQAFPCPVAATTITPDPPKKGAK